MSQYALHSEALADIAEIWEWITADNPSEGHPSAAEPTVTEIYDAFRLLARNPYLGHFASGRSAAPI